MCAMQGCRTRLLLAFNRRPRLAALGASPTQTVKPFEPRSGQPGRMWPGFIPPQALIEKYYDLARVTPEDYVIDLGSGAAAR